MVDVGKIADWLSRLVRIPSVAPAQAGPRAGVPGEARLADEVARWCRRLGAAVTIDQVLPGRPAVYAVWNSRRDRWLAIDAHLDTVGVETMEDDPFSGRIINGRVYGRGSVDTKASLAVVLAMLESLKPRRLPFNFLLAATADEEDSATGAPALARWLGRKKIRIDEMIIAEPSMCAPVIGHKGVVRLRFDLRGRPAHSSNPKRGRNAISAAAKLIGALDEEGRRLAALASPLGAPALTVTLVKGGSGINIVPPQCSVSIDRRVVPGESAAKVRSRLARLAKRASPLPLKATSITAVDAFFESADSEFAQRLSKWSGCDPATVPFCTNAWAYPRAARQRVVLGPGSIAQAHASVEWVEISQLNKLAKIYAAWWGVG